jgi:hypothetical protein
MYNIKMQFIAIKKENSIDYIVESYNEPSYKMSVIDKLINYIVTILWSKLSNSPSVKGFFFVKNIL